MSFSFRAPRLSFLNSLNTWPSRSKAEEENKSRELPTDVESDTKIITDLYGFEISVTAKQEKERKKCEENAQRRAERWHKSGDRKKLPRDRKKLKTMIRKGIPVGMRSWVWMETSGALERQAKAPEDYYQTMVEKGKAESIFARQIELDLPRTYPGHPWLESEAGQEALGRVLLAYSVHNPVTGYCQSMNYIAAMLLLVMQKNEENTFWMLVSLIEEILYPGTYARNLSGCHVEMRSLEELVGIKLPRLARHLKDLYCEMSIIATDWYLCLFTTSLPSEACARVWDSLFNEGPKILFRVAVAILQLAERHLLTFDNAGELRKAVKDFAHNMHHRDKLMKVAFDGIGSLSMATVARLREIKQHDVDEMMRARDIDLARSRQQEKSKWAERDVEESIAGDSDGQSSIATNMTGDLTELSLN